MNKVERLQTIRILSQVSETNETSAGATRASGSHVLDYENGKNKGV